MVTEVLVQTNQSLRELLSSNEMLNSCAPEIKDLPEYYREKSFDNYIPFDDESSKKLNSCKKFAAGETKKKSLTMYGNVGSGKSHLAISILKEQKPRFMNAYRIKSVLEEDNGKLIAVVRSTKCLFLPAEDFFQKMNAVVSNNGSKTYAIKNNYLCYDIVLLDDLSPLNFTPARSENLYSLINGFYNAKKYIIITTNFSLKEFNSIDPRITSRLVEMSEILKFDGEDYRKKVS